MLLTPAVTLVVGLQMLNAYVVGDRVLARAGSRPASQPMRRTPPSRH